MKTASPAATVAADTCSCGHLGGEHRRGMRWGEMTRVGCTVCGCDLFDATDRIERRPPRPAFTVIGEHQSWLCEICGNGWWAADRECCGFALTPVTVTIAARHTD